MPEWLERIWGIINGTHAASIAHRVLLIALLSCSVFAIGQLLTMLGTRWGDRHAMAKSFFLSVLVHLCLGLGWATAVAEFPVGPPGFPSEFDDPVPIQTVISDAQAGEGQSETEDTGEPAIWQQSLSRTAPRIARTEREPSIPQTEPAPRMDREPTTLP